MDALSSRQMREAGRHLLAHARRRAAAAGSTELDARMRHEDFIDTAIELQAGAELVVLGEHHDMDAARLVHAEHHVEQVIRGTAAPVLAATTESFVAPERVVVAFDGSPAASKAVASLVQQPLMVGLPILLAMVGSDTPREHRQLNEAQQRLVGTGCWSRPN